MISNFLVLNVTAFAASNFDLGVQAYQDKSFKLARKHWNDSAKQGNIHAQFNLGIMLVKGIGGKADIKGGVTFFQQTAKSGLASGQYNLALAYYSGLGLNINKPLALQWWQQAAKQGHTLAKFNLGALMWHGDDNGIKQNKKAALELFKQANKDELPQARFFLDKLSAYKRSGQTKAKSRNIASNENSIDNQILSTEPATPKPANDKKTFKAWREAADKGDATAQYHLFELYQQGLGVEQNDQLAFKYVEMSAAQGQTQAQYQLASYYLAGNIVDKNETLALYWMQSAADNNHDKAKDYLEQKRQ